MNEDEEMIPIPKCIHCQIGMTQSVIKLGTIDALAWRCPQCSEEIINPEDAEQALLEAKLRKGITVKVGTLNKAPYVRFPKAFESVIHKGDEVAIILDGPDEIRLKVTHTH